MSHRVMVIDPSSPDEVARCFRVFTHLRPHVTRERFLEQVPIQAREGYHIAVIEDGNEVVAAAGYRVLHFLAWGKVLYVDDLITDPARQRQGLGGALMDWLIDRARTLECQQLHLDTGFQRLDAHRLYLNKGLHLHCHHMAIQLS